MKSRRIILVLALAALAALVIGAGYAAAQPAGDDQEGGPSLDRMGPGARPGPGGPGRRPAIVGEVLGVEGDIITVKTSSGEEKSVKVDDDTRYRKVPDTEATLADVTEGERVALVVGRRQEGEELMARAVIIGVPERLRDRLGPPVVGEVVSLEGDMLTISTPEGEKQVQLPAIAPGMRMGVLTGEDGTVHGLIYNPPERPEGAPDSGQPAEGE